MCARPHVIAWLLIMTRARRPPVFPFARSVRCGSPCLWSTDSRAVLAVKLNEVQLGHVTNWIDMAELWRRAQSERVAWTDYHQWVSGVMRSNVALPSLSASTQIQSQIDARRSAAGQ